MAAPALTNLDKAAILLRVLTPGSSEQILTQLDPVQATRLRTLIEGLSKRPDLESATQQVLREFQALRRSAGSDGASLANGPQHSSNWVAQQYESTQSNSVARAETAPAEKIDHNSGPMDLVTRLAAFNAATLSKVLQAEPSRVLLLVLQALPSEKSAAVLKLLPEEVRTNVITTMSNGVMFPEPVVDCVLRTVVDQSAKQKVDVETSEEADAQVQMLVGIRQSLDREERLRLLGLLSEQNEEIAAKIDDNLYDYTDLLRIEDRSVQRLLTQTDQKTLSVALKTAPDAIKDKVMKNMSERVRSALAEEMEFLGVVPPAKSEEARKAITAIIRTQDKDGSLVWIEATT